MSLPFDSAALADSATVTGERERIEVTAPASGRTIGTISQCEKADVEAAVDQARQAQKAWTARPVSDRASVLRSIGRALLSRRRDLVDCVCTETGKSRRDAIEEVLDAAATARYYADQGPAMIRSQRRSGAVPLATKTIEHTRPLGVVGLVTPWNYPLTLVVSDALPALLAGNAVVIKADEHTPFTALFARQILLDAGVPADIIHILTGEGEPLGEPLIHHCDGIGFTGSTAVGRSIGATAGRALTPMSLELGGKNPLLVLPDADIERAAAGTVRGAFANAGQLCIGIERVYVHRSVANQYRRAVVKRTRDLSLGVGATWDIDVGSLSTATQLEAVKKHVKDARDRGATVVCGGRHRPDIGPWMYEPTILTGVPDEAMLTDTETFGPVISITAVDSIDEAIERANDSDHGLTAAVYGQDTDRAADVAERIDAGTVTVNDPYLAGWGSHDAPMGGMKDSGVGRRHGRQGLTRWTESQTVATQRGPSTIPDWLSNRAWSAGVLGLVRVQLGISKRLASLRNKLGGIDR